MIASAIAGGAKLGALLVSLSCTPAVLDGVQAHKCDEQVTRSWIEPSRDELTACALAASDLRAGGIKAWCEVLPADDLGIEPAAARAEPTALTF